MAQNTLRTCKLQRMGHASAGITIPAEFQRALGITRGDILRLDLVGETIEVRSLNEKTVTLQRASRTRGVAGFLTVR